jgi:hypothetical protein
VVEGNNATGIPRDRLAPKVFANLETDCYFSSGFNHERGGFNPKIVGLDDTSDQGAEQQEPQR